MVVTEFFGYLGLSLERLCTPSGKCSQQVERLLGALERNEKMVVKQARDHVATDTCLGKGRRDG
jgi:hypothetical protein